MNRIYPVIALLCVSMFFSSSIYAQSCSGGNINICMKEANQGNAASQYYLGFFYDTGEGVKQDKQKAVEWYRKAAEQGDARAQIDLGFAYSHGEGVKQDKQKAVEWYRKAAEQGNAIAQYNLGSVYDTGKGVKQNKQESVEWYRKAAEQGEVNAQYSLAYAYDTGEGVKQDHQKAAQWYEKAARQGDGEAQYTLGNIYKRGQGISQNNIAAYMWLTLAAENGIAQALKERASVEKKLTSAQLKNGQLLVRRWKGRQTIPSIPNFNVDIQVHADASLTVHERITYNFANTQRHGIYRDIPVMVDTNIGSWNIDLKVSTVKMDGQAVPWTVKYNSSSNNPNVHVQIGDPDYSISGQHIYDIFYDVGYGILPLHGQDDMRWNVTGDQWKLMIEKASVTVHLPKQLSQDDIQAHTYSGKAGSTSTEATFNWIDQQTFHADILPLTPGQQLTISLSFAEGLLLHSAKEIAEIAKESKQTIPSIPNFNVDIQVHADASLTVHERITYNFANTQRHGIYRDIPVMVDTNIGSWNIDLKVSTVKMDGQAVPWTVKYNSSSNNPNVHVQIGDPDHTISGQHIYDIFYGVGYGILPLHGQDDMRWNVTGDQWKLMIEKASVTVHLPKQLSQDDIQARTYSGKADSTSTEATFSWIDQQTFHADILPLTTGQQLTISLPFAEGLLLHSAKEIAEITKKEEPSWLRTYWHWCTFAFGVLWIFLYWFLRGRDPSPKTVTACYQPPEGIDAAHASLILEGNADASLDATVLELVRDNYIAIKQAKSKWFEQKGRALLTYLKIDDTLPPYKQRVMDALFYYENTFDMSERKNERESEHIRSKLAQMKTLLSVWSVEKGYMKSNPEDAKNRFLTIGLLLTGLLFLIAIVDTVFRDGFILIFFILPILGVFLAVLATLVYLAKKFTRMFVIFVAGLCFVLWFYEINVADALVSPFMTHLWLDLPILSQCMLAILIIIVAPYMPVKTALGTDIYAQLLGLKEFMSRVNKLDLEEMLQKDPGYMHALIPYAQVFGLLEHWVHQVKGLEQLTQDRANHTFEDSHLGELAGVSILTAGISGSLHNSGADSFSGGSSGGGSDSGGGGGGGGGGSW